METVEQLHPGDVAHDEGQGETRGSAPGKMIETTGQRGRLSTKLGNSK